MNLPTKRRVKICPDCNIREVDYHCQRCSECAEFNREMSQLKGQHTYLSKPENRLKHNNRAAIYNRNNCKPRSYWRELALK